MPRTLLKLLVFTPLFIGSTILAGEHPQQKLKQIDTKIAQIKAVISHDQTKRNRYLKQLKAVETASGAGRLELQKTSQVLQKQQANLNRLNQNAGRYQAKLTAQQDWLARQIRAAYLLGRQPYLKLILSQSEADRISRLLMYYRYLTQDRLAAIRDLQETLTQVQDTQQKIQTERQKLKSFQRQQQQAQIKLAQIKNSRQQIVTQLNNEIQNKNQKLTELLANKRLLERTLSHLEHQTHLQAESNQNFAALKGQLSWPTHGKVLPYFGTPIYQSELTWDGILIKAPEDQPGYAVANGPVVFSKWLPGYG